MKSKIFKKNRISKHYKTVAILLFLRGLRRKTSEKGKKLLHGKHFFSGDFLGKRQGVKRRSSVFKRCGLRCRGIGAVCPLRLSQRRFTVHVCRLCKEIVLFCLCRVCRMLACWLFCWFGRGVLISLYYRLLKAAFLAVARKVSLFSVKCGRLAFTVLRKCCR